MIRISKITDYGLVLLSQMARTGEKVWTAKDLSQSTQIPLPTVGKVLKLLSKNAVLMSTRGSQGGYKLATQPDKVSLARLIKILEGYTALTDCSETGNHNCTIEGLCMNKTNWQKINQALFDALEDLSLADMSKPLKFKASLLERSV